MPNNILEDFFLSKVVWKHHSIENCEDDKKKSVPFQAIYSYAKQELRGDLLLGQTRAQRQLPQK